MDPRDEPRAESEPPDATIERRVHDRVPADGLVRMRLDPEALDGRLENLSDGGAFVTVDRALDVEVLFEVDGEERVERARLVRYERMPGGTSGWGLTFRSDED